MAYGKTFSIDVDGLERWGADLKRLGHNQLPVAIRRALRGKAGDALVNEMREHTPQRSGKLYAGIGIHEGTGGAVEVGYHGSIRHLGAWIESGTKPHEIRARDGGSLSIGGNQYEKVDHPGFKGRKIAHTAINSAEWRVLDAIVGEIDAMIGGN